MRRVLHAMLAMLGVVVWLVWCGLFSVMLLLALLAHWIWPTADIGNCWAFALPRWWLRGGYLAIVPSSLWLGPVPILHAALVRAPAPDLIQTTPVTKARTAREAWFGLKSLYFKYRVTRGPDRRAFWRQDRW